MAGFRSPQSAPHRCACLDVGVDSRGRIGGQSRLQSRCPPRTELPHSHIVVLHRTSVLPRTTLFCFYSRTSSRRKSAGRATPVRPTSYRTNVPKGYGVGVDATAVTCILTAGLIFADEIIQIAIRNGASSRFSWPAAACTRQLPHTLAGGPPLHHRTTTTLQHVAALPPRLRRCLR